MLVKDVQMQISDFSNLYDRLIPADHLLRQFSELVDFSFIYDELESKYCIDNGRLAYHPVLLFKYLLLKSMYSMSDRDLVERSMFDMSFKYFLGLRPEDDVINPTSLTKFRKLRLKDENILDILISKTVKIALEKGVIKSKSIIVDSTHTKSRYNQKSVREVLQEQAKQLRRAVYTIDESQKKNFPAKIDDPDISANIEYCKTLLEVIEANEKLMALPAVKERAHVLRESVDDSAEHLKTSLDEDAKVGHKSCDSAFFGYKEHLAMTPEGIITAAVVTSGEKNDGKELSTLVEKTRNTGLTVKTVIGDTAYSGKDNLTLAQELHDSVKNFDLVSRLNPVISSGNRSDEDGFEYNKDAGMMICPAGHMSISKTTEKRNEKNKNDRIKFTFNVEKCKVCPLRDGCYKEGAKSKTYSVTIMSDLHKDQLEFQKSDEFKDYAKERYKIEQKNSELKNRHGLDVAESSGISGMELQSATAIFVVNIKRILTLIKQKITK